MGNFELDFTKILGRLHHDSVKLENAVLRNDRASNLTVNEIHLIECIKLSTKGGEGPTISSIASQLDITRPSATVAVNKLETKKFVEKTGCANDGRSVRVKLTAKGDKAYSALKKHNSNLAAELKERFSDEERQQLAAYFEKLEEFFDEKLREKAGEDDY